jgi:hypothetical protein
VLEATATNYSLALATRGLARVVTARIDMKCFDKNDRLTNNTKNKRETLFERMLTR